MERIQVSRKTSATDSKVIDGKTVIFDYSLLGETVTGDIVAKVSLQSGSTIEIHSDSNTKMEQVICLNASASEYFDLIKSVFSEIQSIRQENTIDETS